MFGFDALGLAFGFLTGGAGFAVPAIGAGASVLATFFKGAGKWVLLLIAFLALGSWGAAQRVHVADLRADRAELQGKVGVLTLERDQAKANTEAVDETNRHNQVQLAQLRARSQQQIAECSAEIRRLAARQQRAIVTTERIQHAPACTGIPDAYRAVFDELRQRDADDDRARGHTR